MKTDLDLTFGVPLFISPIAHIETDLPTKFGVPRQSGLVPELKARIVFEPPYRDANALRGLDGFDYIWLIWHFSANEAHSGEAFRALVRPPRLGGNDTMGVFATRSSFRPNGLALSSLKIERLELDTPEGPVIHVLGADLMDGTPIYDIKPYVTFTDSHPEARNGFVDTHAKPTLTVHFPSDLLSLLPPDKQAAAMAVIEQDPRPSYQSDSDRIYGVPFAGYDIRFRVDAELHATVVEVNPLK